MIPWEMGKQLVWGSLMIQGSLCNRGTATYKAEAGKIEKYSEWTFIHFLNIFQLVATGLQGSLGKSSDNFTLHLCKMLCSLHDNQRSSSFLRQRISMALHVGNAASVLGTVSDRDAFQEIHLI